MLAMYCTGMFRKHRTAESLRYAQIKFKVTLSGWLVHLLYFLREAPHTFRSLTSLSSAGMPDQKKVIYELCHFYGYI